MYLPKSIILVCVAARALAHRPAQAPRMPTSTIDSREIHIRDLDSCSRAEAELSASFEPGEWEAMISIGSRITELPSITPVTPLSTGTCPSLPEVTGSQGRVYTEMLQSLGSYASRHSAELKKAIDECSDGRGDPLKMMGGFTCLDSIFAQATPAKTTSGQAKSTTSGDPKSSAGRNTAVAELAISMAIVALIWH